MDTPFDVLGVIDATGSKLVAALYLPTGLSRAAGTTINGGSVTGTITLAADATPIYGGLVESPAGSGQFTLRSTISGTVLPDCVNAPYLIEVRAVDAGTDMTSYTAIALAFAASTTIRYSLGPAMYAGGYLFDGAWNMLSTGSGLSPSQQAQLNRIEARANQFGAATVTYTGPVASDGSGVVYQGDDYLDGRELSWKKSNYTGPSLASATLVARWVQRSVYDKATTAPAALSVVGTVSTVTELDGSTTATFNVPLTGSETADLESVPLDDPYNWVVQLVVTTADSRVQTEFLNAVTVRRRVVP